MRVTRLKLANVRAIKTAEFRFLPGVNLVVGVNGAGKTTVLDALAACFAEFVSNNVRVPRHPTLLAQPSDVRAGAKALDVECEFEYGGAMFAYSHHKLALWISIRTEFASRRRTPAGLRREGG